MGRFEDDLTELLVLLFEGLAKFFNFLLHQLELTDLCLLQPVRRFVHDKLSEGLVPGPNVAEEDLCHLVVLQIERQCFFKSGGLTVEEHTECMSRQK